ncbi:MAG: aerotolerance regulator BatA, partial [bacterium]
KIATLTGGAYFRATTAEGLREIYSRIDELEKTKVQVEHVRHWRERFYSFAALAFMLLVIERLLVLTRMRRLAV